ncbi:trypsin-like peptidase domain-containing protein [Actinocrinis puniceicyclus]|uniref:Trypsin-like peptidase domain-containing protein n=1 Tax=Actinocrinis puniceicyclus TaxID=977794 RepID=A0A8J7WW19_9ACTN|nr:trypsin-like peptidase domain-containing protein [Actinocrinis puniceicyclus]MBS2966947.1 trypsin-like peptidase domain-containing protein [Actinocrinis puniceicyclus]
MSERAEAADAWRARIWSPYGEVAGAGVLISQQHVLTCAHVVNPDDEQDSKIVPAPPGQIEIDFPGLRHPVKHRAHVLEGGWFPKRGQDADIAILRLDEPVAIPNAVLRPSAGRVGHQLSVFGYTVNNERGVRTWLRQGEAPAPETDWVQLRADSPTDKRVERGFSGAGVVDAEDGAILGIIVTFDEDERAHVSWMLPTETITRYWPLMMNRIEIAERRFVIEPLDLTAVASCAPWPDSHEVSAVTASGRLIRRWWDCGGTWSHWYDAAPPARPADLSAFSRAAGEMDCVTADEYGRVWHSSRRAGRWGNWEPIRPPDTAQDRLRIASPVIARVTTVSSGPSHAELFAVTSAGELIHRWHWAENAEVKLEWSTWHLFKTQTRVSDVGAASMRPGHVLCVIADEHGRCWRAEHNGGRWSSWEEPMRIPEGTKSPAIKRVAAASLAPGHHEVFAVTSAGELIHRWQREGSDWSAWHTFETPEPVADVAASTQPDGTYECLIASTTGRLWYARFDNATYWSAWATLGTLPLPER